LATTKPRITITADQDVYDTLRELAELQGRSMSSLVSDLLTLSNPVQQRVLAALRHATSLQAEAQADLVDQLERAQGEAEAMIRPLLGLLEGFGAAAQPPHSNTGVTHPNHQTEHVTKKTAKPRPRAVLSEKDRLKEERKAREAEKTSESYRIAQDDDLFSAALRGSE